MPTAELLPGAVRMPSDDQYVNLRVPADVGAAINKWWHAHEYPSRTSAMIALLRWALAQNPELRPDAAD